MKNLLLFFLLVCLSLAMGCDKETITPSEEITVVAFDLPAFTAIDASSDFEVRFTNAAGPEIVELEANANLQGEAEIEVVNGVLRVGFKRNFNIRGEETLILRVITSNAVNDFRVSSDARIDLETPLNVNNASVEVNSDGKFTGEMNANNLIVEANSDGEVSIFGLVGRLEADLSSDAKLRDFGLLIDDLVIELSSDATAELSVNNTLDAKANSGASLVYRGDPEILRLETNSDGEIRRDN